jgi:hypothetical protein
MAAGFCFAYRDLRGRRRGARRRRRAAAASPPAWTGSSPSEIWQSGSGAEQMRMEVGEAGERGRRGECGE